VESQDAGRKYDLEKLAGKVIAQRLQAGKSVADLQQALNNSKTGREGSEAITTVLTRYVSGA
jgi:hypothetical protein